MLFGQPARDDRGLTQIAALLATDSALLELSPADARVIATYMASRSFRAGDVVVREGEHIAGEAGFMALVVDGELTVESTSVAAHESLVVSVKGPGSLIGEMSLFDGGPRSATCTAATDAVLATLHRDALRRLLHEQPSTGARFLLGLCQRMAVQLRTSNRKLIALGQVGKAAQQELDAAHSINKRLLNEVDRLSHR